MNTDYISTNRSLPAGTILNGRFVINEKLGEGGFGITYLATHSDMKKKVAIKEFFCTVYMYRDTRISNEIHLDQESDQRKLSRDLDHFLNEARILAELSDIPGITHVTDYFRENGTAYIVMDYIKGTSLAEQLNSGIVFPWDDIITKILPLVKALSLVHKKGMIHRDIKPENIIISEAGQFTLIDFGAALHYVGEETHSVYLSEGYAPKEQYLRKARLGPYTDIYALCALIYHCMTGQIPEHSIQRTVFDELKRPSDMGIAVPGGVEDVLMEGLQIEPEMRLQSMDELYQRFSDRLPKPKKPGKVKYMLAGVAGVTLAMILAFIIVKYPELRIRQMEKSGAAVSFTLDAPDMMTADEFDGAIQNVKERTEIFTGNNNYLMKAGSNRISLTIPKDCFAELDDWDLQTQLAYCFSFRGAWSIPNKERSDVIRLSPDDLKSIDLNYGGIPVITNSGDKLLYDGEAIDWSSEETYYIKMEFNEDTAAFMSDYLNTEGYIFPAKASAVFNSNDIFTVDGWISGGDGKTAYYPVAGADGKNIADIILLEMTSQAYSGELELTLIEEDMTVWENPGTSGKYQRQAADFDIPTVEVIYSANTGNDAAGARELCTKQLELLEIPFSIGTDQKNIHVRAAADEAVELILMSMCGANLQLSTKWNHRFYTRSVDAKPHQSDRDSSQISIYVSEDDLLDEETDILRKSSETGDVFLYMEDTRIGTLSSFDEKTGECVFDLLIDKTLPISKEKLIEYICNAARASGTGSYGDRIWRDGNGEPMPKKDIPVLPTGIDTARFSSLEQDVNALGGDVSFAIKYGREELNITFLQWSGNFPEEALEMIEKIFEDNQMSANICDHISFKVNSWYKGEPVQIYTLFEPEKGSESVICTKGQVICRDEEVLRKASDYVSKSHIFTPADDRLMYEDRVSESSGWEYCRADWLGSQ